MTCRGCGHIYPISNGIPNMVSLLPPIFVISRDRTKAHAVQILAEHEVGR